MSKYLKMLNRALLTAQPRSQAGFATSADVHFVPWTTSFLPAPVRAKQESSDTWGRAG